MVVKGSWEDVLPDFHETMGLWPITEEDAFAMAYSDYLHVPCPEPQIEYSAISSASEDPILEIPCAYTQEKDLTPNPPPLVELEPNTGTIWLLSTYQPTLLISC